jgi:hypothetical protein
LTPIRIAGIEPARHLTAHVRPRPGERSADLDQLKSLLKPYPADDMVRWPVDRRVGNVKNKDPALIEPAPATG